MSPHSNKILFVIVLCASLFQSAPLAALPLTAGEYRTEQGWGRLILGAPVKGAMAFRIRALGSNGHSCLLKGEVRNGLANLAAGNEKESCQIRFKPTRDGVEVVNQSGGETCAAYCGARASFPGEYLHVPRLCEAAAVSRERLAFSAYYKSKDYAAAREKLESLFNLCGNVLDLWDQYRIRNDLAVTYHHLKDDTSCLSILDPLKEISSMSDDRFDQEYPASEAIAMRAAVRAARTNLRLCSAQR